MQPTPLVLLGKLWSTTNQVSTIKIFVMTKAHMTKD